MPKKCIVPNCKIQDDYPGCLLLCFRKFPKNEEYKKSWIEALRNNFSDDQVEESLKPVNPYICDLHFNVECFYRTGVGKNLLLQRGSIPTIFENCKSIEQKAVAEKCAEIYKFVSQNSVYSKGQTSLNNCSNAENTNCEKSNNIQDENSTNNVDSNSTSNSTTNCNDSDNTLDNCLQSSNVYNNVDISKDKSDSVNKSSRKRKSFGEVDLRSIDYTNFSNIKKLLKKAQKEVLSQRRIIIQHRKDMQILRKRVYRLQEKVLKNA